MIQFSFDPTCNFAPWVRNNLFTENEVMMSPLWAFVHTISNHHSSILEKQKNRKKEKDTFRNANTLSSLRIAARKLRVCIRRMRITCAKFWRKFWRKISRIS